MIKINKKKCKGTGKAIGYGCSDICYTHKYGLCKSCFKKWLFNTESGRDFLNKSRITGKNKVDKEEKARARKLKEQVKRKSEYQKDLQVIINQIVRLIDIDKGCISCHHGWDKEWTRQKHAGHRLSVGSNQQLRYNLFNIHLQCSVCNNYKSGNSREYDKGLIEIYGESYLENCKSLTSRYTSINLSTEDIREVIFLAKEIRKNIFSGKSYTREEVNGILNVY